MRMAIRIPTMSRRIAMRANYYIEFIARPGHGKGAREAPREARWREIAAVDI
jgi:hypothetical protein